jgi:hypothetical protein
MELSDQGEELSATDRSSKNLGTTTKNKEGHYVVRKFHGRTAYLRADSLYAGLSQALSHFPEVAGLVTFPTFLPARPVTAADLAALTERVRRWKSVRPEANGVVELTPPRVPRQARRSCPAAAEAPASLSRGVCAESQAEAGRYGARDREYRQAARGRDRRACGQSPRYGWLLRRESKAPLARHLPDRLGQAPGPGGRGVSARVPSVWRRHPADRLQTAFRVRNHPWPSHSWQPPVAADFLSANRGRSARSSRTWANHSNRRRCRPPAARPPTGASSCKSMMNATSFRRRQTSCPQSTSTASDRCRTLGIDEAARRPDSERLRAHAGKTPLQGGRQAGRERPGADRGKRARSSRAAHQLGNRCGSAIGRAILREWLPAAATAGLHGPRAPCGPRARPRRGR